MYDFIYFSYFAITFWNVCRTLWTPCIIVLCLFCLYDISVALRLEMELPQLSFIDLFSDSPVTVAPARNSVPQAHHLDRRDSQLPHRRRSVSRSSDWHRRAPERPACDWTRGSRDCWNSGVLCRKSEPSVPPIALGRWWNVADWW